MNIIRATHQLALDMSTLAELSKAKGFAKDANDFYVAAYELEKKAAIMTSSQDEDPIPHFILLRSAAALAYKSKLYKESENLIEMCLSENPPLFIQKDLKKISELIQKSASTRVSETIFHLQIEGRLTNVNADKNEITIKDDTQKQNYAVIVPQNQLAEIIKNHWFQNVLIKVRQTNYGVMVLEKINAAA